MGHLGHVLVLCPILGHLYLSVYKNKGLKNSPGWVTLLYLTCTSIEVLEVHTGFVPHFEVHNSISHSYAWLKILQDGLQFSAPQVPHMGHLGHLLVMCPILGHLYLSVNENAVLKIVQDGLHFGSSQAAHLSCLSCCIEKQLILSCPYFYWIILVIRIQKNFISKSKLHYVTHISR